MHDQLPLLEFDPDPAGLINPSELHARRAGSVPEVAVLCFFSEVIEELAGRRDVKVVGRLVAAHGSHEILVIERDGRHVAVVHPGVGAPLAGAFFEEMIALGAGRVVACGGAGALVPELALGHVVVPTSAIRDEGTSYHYLPPSREVRADASGVAAAERVLEERGVPYTLGKTWSTDAFYRETRKRVDRRAAEGCVTVEMECAAFLAIAKFRGVRFAQLLYAGDDLSGEVWDGRGWETSPSRPLLFDLAVRTALAL